MVNTYEDTLYLRDASNCPPDVPLKDWLILLSNFFDKHEGGQKIYLLEKENDELKREVIRFQEKNGELNEKLQQTEEDYNLINQELENLNNDMKSYLERLERDNLEKDMS